MYKPKMILFDYGQTLISEAFFDGIKGTQAVLKYLYESQGIQANLELWIMNEELDIKNWFFS